MIIAVIVLCCKTKIKDNAKLESTTESIYNSNCCCKRKRQYVLCCKIEITKEHIGTLQPKTNRIHINNIFPISNCWKYFVVLYKIKLIMCMIIAWLYVFYFGYQVIMQS